VEACEYDRSFHHVTPACAVITNIEEDHLDYYSDLAEIVEAFRQFAAKPEIVVANKIDLSGGAEAVAALAERLAKRPPEVLVNNAAIYAPLKRRSFMEIPVEEWDRVMEVNLRGLFLCARAVFPAMKAQGKGKIINISSGTFFKGIPHFIHYTTSKGGVVGFTRSLARELGEFGIRVNAVAPGLTMSGQNEATTDEDVRQFNIRSRMLQRTEVPEDIVGTVVFLASDGSDFITGQTILVDGGSSVH